MTVLAILVLVAALLVGITLASGMDVVSCRATSIARMLLLAAGMVGSVMAAAWAINVLCGGGK